MLIFLFFKNFNLTKFSKETRKNRKFGAIGGGKNTYSPHLRDCTSRVVSSWGSGHVRALHVAWALAANLPLAKLTSHHVEQPKLCGACGRAPLGILDFHHVAQIQPLNFFKRLLFPLHSSLFPFFQIFQRLNGEGEGIFRERK